MDWYDYILFLLGGLLAGSVNTLAGYGSIITLSLLMEVGGLPANMANGTNRLGVLSNSMAGAFGFYKNGKLSLSKSWPFIVIAFIGAIPGVYAAIQVSNGQFRNIFRILIFSMFIFMLTKPKRWLIKETQAKEINWWIIVPVFLAIGFYGGFIQFGLGFFILASLVLYSKIEMIEANAIKLAIIGTYSIMALYIFHTKGLVDWKLGAILAVGQAAGSYWTAQFAATHDGIRIWAFRLLVAIIAIIICREVYLFLIENNFL